MGFEEVWKGLKGAMVQSVGGVAYGDHDDFGAHQPLGPVAGAGEVPFKQGNEGQPRQCAKDSGQVWDGRNVAFTEDVADEVEGHIDVGEKYGGRGAFRSSCHY